MPSLGGQPGGHGPIDLPPGCPGPVRRCPAGVFFQVAALAGGYQPVGALGWSGCSRTGSRRRRGTGRSRGPRLVAVPRPWLAGGAVRRRCRAAASQARASIGVEPVHVGGVTGELGGDDQPVVAGDVLGVVALDEPAAAHGHQPRVRVGDVARPGSAVIALPRPCAPASGGALPGLLQLARRPGGPGSTRWPGGAAGCAAASRPRPATRRCGPPRRQSGPAARRSPGPARMRRCGTAAPRAAARAAALPAARLRQVGPRPSPSRSCLLSLPLGLQVRQRRRDPLAPRPRIRDLRRQLIPARSRPE